MATIRELLQEKLDRAIKEHGPDDQLAKALKAQIASLGTVRHPSQLAALNSSKNDKYHGAILEKGKSSQAQPEPDQLTMHNKVESLLPDYLRNLDKQDAAPSKSAASTTRSK